MNNCGKDREEGNKIAKGYTKDRRGSWKSKEDWNSYTDGRPIERGKVNLENKIEKKSVYNSYKDSV